MTNDEKIKYLQNLLETKETIQEGELKNLVVELEQFVVKNTQMQSQLQKLEQDYAQMKQQLVTSIYKVQGTLEYLETKIFELKDSKE
jgi:predicted nuclease with TOPRIM domain